MNLPELIQTRISCAKLQLPVPAQSILDEAFACALRAPDHRVLQPWRYLHIEGSGLVQLGKVFAQAGKKDNPAIEEAESERLEKMPLRAPLIIAAIMVEKDDSKVPRDEFLLSAGAAVQNFMLSLHAHGFGSMWRTGPLANHPVVKESLGIGENETIVGFIYVGTPVNSPRHITPLPVQDFVSLWPS